jgi:hypothetical protein
MTSDLSYLTLIVTPYCLEASGDTLMRRLENLRDKTELQSTLPMLCILGITGIKFRAVERSGLFNVSETHTMLPKVCRAYRRIKVLMEPCRLVSSELCKGRTTYIVRCQSLGVLDVLELEVGCLLRASRSVCL